MPSDKPNGVACQVHYLANALCKSGHSVTCVSFSPCPEQALYRHRLLTYRSAFKLMRKFEPALGFLFKSKDTFDVFHFHGDDYLIWGNSKRIRTFYGSALFEAMYATKIPRFLYQLLFYFFEWLSLLNRGTKVGISESTRRALPFISNIIPCGVPLEVFCPGDRKFHYPSILFLGDLHSRKCGKYLVEIFNDVIIKQYPNCILTIVGPEPCEGKNIRYIGNINEQRLVSEYRKSWIYCMVSSYEGFGVPVIEAMACGTAVVAVDNPGIKSIVHHGYDSLISDKNGLADNLMLVLRDHELRNRLVTNGLDTIHRKFDIHSIAEKYEQVYTSI